MPDTQDTDIIAITAGAAPGCFALTRGGVLWYVVQQRPTGWHAEDEAPSEPEWQWARVPSPPEG